MVHVSIRPGLGCTLQHAAAAGRESGLAVLPRSLCPDRTRTCMHAGASAWGPRSGEALELRGAGSTQLLSNEMERSPVPGALASARSCLSGGQPLRLAGPAALLGGQGDAMVMTGGILTARAGP